MKEDNVEEYYNNFFTQKENVQVNERIYFCFTQMKRLGLSAASTVLELGCGPGALTWLVSKKLKKGIAEAVDLSSYAVKFAQEHINQKNVFIYQGDITVYKPRHAASFDFITLFDIIEHIPLQQHEALFKNISAVMHAQSLLLINVPNPRYIEYDRIHQPGSLQIIDQPVYINHLNDIFTKHGLLIHEMKTHSVWVKDDYQFYVLTRKNEFEEIKLSSGRNIIQKILARVKHAYLTYILRYP